MPYTSQRSKQEIKIQELELKRHWIRVIFFNLDLVVFIDTISIVLDNNQT